MSTVTGEPDATTLAPAPGLSLEYVLNVTLKPPVEIGAGPYGTRVFYEVDTDVPRGRAFKPTCSRVAVTGCCWMPATSGAWTCVRIFAPTMER